jgi:hypothetical protein
MRILIPLQALGAVAIIAMIAACTGNSAIAPGPASPQAVGSGSYGPIVRLKVNSLTRHQSTSFYSCSRHGSVEYVSDYSYNVIYVYVGKFSGQAPCAQITSSLLNPAGLYVEPTSHDLYVANFSGYNVLVFHKGQTTPYNAYTDPTHNQEPLSVTVANDGTVIASNGESNPAIERGSISTWIAGPSGGTFVGNFPMTNDQSGGDLAIKRDGTIFYSDVTTGGDPALWKVSCPAGACGAETQVAGVSQWLEGMLFDDTGDLLAIDNPSCTLDTFELPISQPSTFSLACYPDAMAFDALHHHLFDTYYDSSSQTSKAQEYTYPGLTSIGTVAGVHQSDFLGMAVDP